MIQPDIIIPFLEGEGGRICKYWCLKKLYLEIKHEMTFLLSKRVFVLGNETMDE